MKIAVLYLICLLCPISVFSQQARIVKKNLEVSLIESSQGTIDSLVIEINGNYSYATFYVTVTSSGNYYSRFWLMGHRNLNGDYAEYDLLIDGTDTGINVSSTSADWQLIGPENNSKIALSVGPHHISLRGLKEDIPNVENLRLYSSPLYMFNNTDNAKYQYAKNHHTPYNALIIPSTVGSYTEINYHQNATDSLTPPSIYHGEFSKYIFYTFYRLQYFVQNETVTLSTDVINGKHHYLHLISLDNPSIYSWVTASTSSGHATLSQTIPTTGFYYVLVRAMGAEDWGTCNLNINGDYLFDNVPIVNHLTEVPSELLSNRIYACFAISAFINPMIWMVGNANSIINFNDDYPYDANLSSYDWKKNARFNQTLTPGMKVLATLEKSFQNGEISVADVYAGGRIRVWDVWYVFPNLKKDDEIITAAADTQYNCLAWALGEWSENFWFSDLYGTSSPYHVNLLDSVCAIYGYTRNGATEANSQIDLWAKIVNGEWDCQHFSVRKRAHKFAGGYAWESKMGGLERMLHPRYDLEGEEYGNIVAHYWKDNTNVVGPISEDGTLLRCFENVTFSDEERLFVDKEISLIPKDIIADFSQKYNDCEKAGMKKLTLFIDVLRDSKGYDDLIHICNEFPLLQYWLFKRIDEGGILAIQLMEDLVATSNLSLFKKVQVESSKRTHTKEGYRIIRTLQANSMLFIKAYLAEQMRIEFHAKDAVTYSNTNMFQVSVSGKNIIISLDLDHGAFVSAVIGSASGTFIKTIESRKHHEAGQIFINGSVPTSGIYIINVHVNGCNYEKVISIQ